jgi:hypothetical protein
VEAVDVYGRLAALDQTVYRPKLAVALTNLGIRLSEVGQCEEALTVTKYAVEACLWLAKLNPTAHTLGLARALWTFGKVRAAGQVDLAEALAAIEASVQIFQGLASLNVQ